MSMLTDEISIVIFGKTPSLREQCLAQIIASPNATAEIEALTKNGSTVSLTVPGKIPNADPDVIILSHEKEKIGVGDVRNFLALLKIKPINRPQKIGVILSAEKLTPEAQNALLKTLEEPPPQTLVLLSVPHPKDLLPTILSRCLFINLGEVSHKGDQVTNYHLSRLSVGEKFALAQKEGATRQQALEFLDQLLIGLHQTLVAGENPSPKLFAKIATAKKIIAANGNVRLTLENLFLDW